MMDIQDVGAVLNLIQAFFPEAKKISKTYGIVHESMPAKMNDMKEFLIWDYIIYNEITFKTMDDKIYSLFTSFSDAKRKRNGMSMWKNLVSKWG